MLQFKKILCPMDFDDNSLSALEYAVDIARENGATLYLLHVARTPAHDMDAPVAIARHPRWEQLALDKLKQIAADRVEGTAADEVVVRGGIPETVIVEFAAERDIDLIVMATHGRTGLAHFILGSVTETVIREASCPVLTIKPKPSPGHHSTSPRSR